ncbi:MAG: hypothetical protein GQ535_10975 [Rhodobacteraceae bacterium]|nr:hypothetical protein [Paracoccaceae bacterium]
MTKPLPSLALDMSQDGIALHQLAFDGHWHELARVALNDPALRARLSNMRSVATKLEGRRVKARVWLPADQIVRANLSILGNEDGARLSHARAEIAAKFGGKPKDYAVQLGKRAEGGAFPVAAVRIRTMQEARTFAKSHGFRAKSYSTQSPIEGFSTPPNFTVPADKVKAVGLGLVAATAATVVLGGGIAFYALDPLNLWEAPPKVSDFAPFQQPNPGIERAGGPAVPNAPIGAPVFPVFAGIASHTAPSTLPYLPPRQLTADAQEVVLAPTAPSAEAAPDAVQMANVTLVNWPATIAALAMPASADALPSIGLFSLQDRIAALPLPALDSPPAPPSGPMLAFNSPPRPMTVANTAFYLEPLPATATRLSQGALADFISRSGLTAAQLSRMPAPLLLIESKVVEVTAGLPPILPRLRSGLAIPPQVAPLPEVETPPAPTGPAPLFTLVSGKPDIIPLRRAPPPIVLPPEEQLPFQLVNGAPDIRPLLRPTPEVVAPPATEAVEPPVDEPEIAVAEEAPIEAAEPDDASLAAAVDAAIESATPETPQVFALLEGQPALLPRLRSGGVISPAGPQLDPATAEANALRPRRRPQTIIDLPAPIDPMISGAAPASASRPKHRGANFAANTARIIEITTSRPRVTAPAVPSDPQTVSLPTSASVARSATIENALNLRKTNLLGIYGTADNRTALILLSSGRRIRVQTGESFSGWTVVAISESTVRIRKRSREEILRMPAE